MRPQLGVDPITQLPTISLDTKVKAEEYSLDSILKIITEINKKEKVVIVLDEFQDIIKLKDSDIILAKLRAKIQFLTDLTFVYAGSDRNNMSSIFSESNSPFFKSALPINIDELDIKLFSRFIKNKFNKGKRDLTNKLLEEIFNITQNVTGDVQQLCEAIWSTSSYEESLDVHCLPLALDLIFSHEQKAYDRIMLELTEFQTRVLINIVKVGGEEINSNFFLESGGFTNPSSIKQAVNKLQNIEVLFRPGKEYKFVNPFFKMWLKNRFL